MKAIIPCAGKGTRMQPTSNLIPKEIMPVWKKNGVQLAVEEATNAGFKDIVIVSSKEKISFFKSLFKDNNNVSIVIQCEPRGLADAILTGYGDSYEDVGIILPDEYIPNGIKSLIESNANILVSNIPEAKRHKYGMIEQIYGIICRVIEKPKQECQSNLGIIGRYLLPRSFISVLKSVYLSASSSGIKSEDVFSNAIEKYSLSVFPNGLKVKIWNGVRFDMGEHIGWLQACNYECIKECESNRTLLKVSV